jgi:hypothetical protein
MDNPDLSTDDLIYIRAGAHETRDWQRTFAQVQHPELALAQMEAQARKPYDWEDEDVF